MYAIQFVPTRYNANITTFSVIISPFYNTQTSRSFTILTVISINS